MPRPPHCGLPVCEHVFVSGDATILHADLDAFYASVEQRDDPRLRGPARDRRWGRGAGGQLRGQGLRHPHSHGRSQARQLCPWAIVVEPRMSAYSEASKAVFAVFENTTPLVEGLSIDEAFLDVGGLRRVSGTPTRSRSGCARTSSNRSGCPSPSAWPAPSSWPRWPAGWPSPTACWWCRPPRSCRSCIRWPSSGCGGRAGHRGQAARPRHHHRGRGRADPRAGAGVDARPGIRPPPPRAGPQPRPSPGAGRSPPAVDRVTAGPWPLGEVARGDRHRLVGVVDRVTRRMRAAGRAGRTVVLRIRFDDFTRATRSYTLPRATAHTETILRVARFLLAAVARWSSFRASPSSGCRSQPRRQGRRAARAALRLA